MSNTADTNDARRRRAYYDRISAEDFTPLWEVLSAIITKEPKSDCVAHLWRYEKARDYLLEAGELITAREAERRVLILENPGLRGMSRITTSLYAGLQLVLPDEVAPAHRHTQSALRFIVEGSGGHTAVNGERTTMEVGDFVITPPWTFHDHGNPTDDPMIWLDGLDIPMVSFFDASFAEGHPDEEQSVTRVSGDSQARYGANMLPVDYDSRAVVSPVFSYPYARTRDALEIMRRQAEWDPCHGLKMRYINPNTGDFAMPTIATFMQLLPKAFVTAPYRSTDAMVFAVVEGSGTSTVDGVDMSWGPKDIFVAPSWKWIRHHASEDAVLFSFSDRAAQQKLGLWREQRGES